MAKTNSTEILTKEIVGDLNVSDIFTELMKKAVDKDSIYIRTKETLTSFMDKPVDGMPSMTASEKANVLSQALVSMSTSITSQAMDTAFKMAKENRDAPYVLSKLKADTLVVKEQADKIAADNVLATAQAAKVNKDSIMSTIQGWKLQSDMVRENGVMLFPPITSPQLPVGNVGARGMKWETEQQTKMSVYATLAKSFRESGFVTWTTDTTGSKITGIADESGPAREDKGLTHVQTMVAKRQELGFDDNKRQHAANSSANMIGLLLSAQETGAINADDVAQWRTAIGYLNAPSSGIQAHLTGIITTVSFTEGGTISKAAEITITGSSENFLAGTAITCRITTGAEATYKTSNTVSGLILEDGTWSLTVAPTDMNNLSTIAGEIFIQAVDSNGTIISDNTVTTCTIGA